MNTVVSNEYNTKKEDNGGAKCWCCESYKSS